MRIARLFTGNDGRVWTQEYNKYWVANDGEIISDPNKLDDKGQSPAMSYLIKFFKNEKK